MMSDWIEATIRRHAVPLEPRATGVPPRLSKPLGLRGILFDIYGTLLVSAVGDIGSSEMPEAEAAEGALRALGCEARGKGERVATTLRRMIDRHHAEAKEQGIDYPEVAIDRMWRRALDELVDQGRLPTAARQLDARRVSLEYEMRVNPVWPMSGLSAMLDRLSRLGLVLGIISNAQWFTRPIFETLTGKNLAHWGITDDLQIYSYRLGRAKPSARLFRAAATALARRGVSPSQVLYLGNDMRNDCWGAGRAGFNTALFAGDERSLRLREDDPLVQGYEPDWVVTDLRELAEAVTVTALR